MFRHIPEPKMQQIVQAMVSGHGSIQARTTGTSLSRVVAARPSR